VGRLCFKVDLLFTVMISSILTWLLAQWPLFTVPSRRPTVVYLNLYEVSKSQTEIITSKYKTVFLLLSNQIYFEVKDDTGIEAYCSGFLTNSSFRTAKLTKLTRRICHAGVLFVTCGLPSFILRQHTLMRSCATRYRGIQLST
jgi:hypothetical protein